MKENKPAWTDEKHNWWNNPHSLRVNTKARAMYEIIELATGKSHYFEHCQCKCCLQYFELPPTLPESFPSLPGLVRLAIESEIRGGDSVSWYGGIYVRKVNV